MPVSMMPILMFSPLSGDAMPLAPAQAVGAPMDGTL